MEKELAEIFAAYHADADFKNPLQKIVNKLSPVLNQADPFWELAAQSVLYASALSLLFDKDTKAEDFTLNSIRARALGKKDYNDIKSILQARLRSF